MSSSVDVLGIFTIYPSSENELPGVRKDLFNVLNLCWANKLSFLPLNGTFDDKTTILKTMMDKRPAIIWISGHGIFHEGENDYILPTFFSESRRFGRSMSQQIEEHSADTTISGKDFGGVHK